MRSILTLVSWLVASVLLFFTARRWLFILAALLPNQTRLASKTAFPPVLILVPARNEGETLPALLAALDQLTYPAGCITVVLLDDGSTDDTQRLMHRWAEPRENWHVLSLAHNVGKAKALNVGLSQFPQGEIVVIYDADERPQPEALRYLVAPFSDPRVGAVSGRRVVSNALHSPAASYTTFEGLVHQLVTMRAKDRLDLAPATLGANCAYRRQALESVGAFRQGALLEDSDLSLKLPWGGWKIRFEPAAVSTHAVPHSLSGYWQQHTRWARGFNEVAREHAGQMLLDTTTPLLLRLELLAFSLGYLDRVALAVAGGLFLLKKWTQFPGWVIGASLLTPFLQTLAALKIDQAPRPMWVRVIWLPLFFSLDLAMAANGLWRTLSQRPQIWEERGGRQ